MWIFLPEGFLSVVADRNKPFFLQVRARRKKVLEQHFPGELIIENKKADYRFRVVIPRARFSLFMACQISNIDYHNFKNRIQVNEKADLDYVELCHEVWSMSAAYQHTDDE